MNGKQLIYEFGGAIFVTYQIMENDEAKLALVIMQENPDKYILMQNVRCVKN